MKKRGKKPFDKIDERALCVIMDLRNGGLRAESMAQNEFDLEALKFWMKTSTKARLNWLESAFEFMKT